MGAKAKWTVPVLTGLLLAGAWLALPEPHVLDLEGNRVDPLARPRPRATVLLFLRTDCPISNRYAPEILRLYQRFGASRVNFWLVYLDQGETTADIEAHLRAYNLPRRALRDPNHALVELTGATITPEAAVFTADRTMIYRGRIDDRYIALGKARAAPTQRDLEEALTDILAGQNLPPRTTPAVGCFIADLQ
ncbi:MAG: redoxin domain-containing protein [Candidatus Latescibacteria bacterium]|nr:redoxin domain-containing protein [Candidatus Latescibacterota bacterium]